MVRLNEWGLGALILGFLFNPLWIVSLVLGIISVYKKEDKKWMGFVCIVLSLVLIPLSFYGAYLEASKVPLIG